MQKPTFLESLRDKVLGAGRVAELEERELDRQVPVNARATARARQRALDRRRRKGQIAFTRQQLARAYRDDTIRAQMRALDGPDTPMRRNVLNATMVTYGDQLQGVQA